jgi:hypothetical protein
VLIAPLPRALTARKRTLYDNPLVNPPITIGLAVEAGLRVTQVDPLFTEY